MAIDTHEKRRSIAGLLNIHPGILPNASKDVEWRQAAGYSYMGFAGDLEPPVIIVVSKSFLRKKGKLVAIRRTARTSLSVGTDAYVAGDALGVKQGLNVSPYGIIRSIVITDADDKASTTQNVWIFDSEPTGIAANAAFALSDADLEKVVGVHLVNVEFDAINGRARFEEMAIPFEADGGVLWIQVENEAGTPTYTTTDDVKIQIWYED